MNESGLTLIELLAVITILGILLAIAVPSYFSYIEETKADVCDVNRVKLKETYEAQLSIDGMTHREVLFRKFLLEYNHDICPDDGEIVYLDKEINCHVHQGENDVDDNENGVPFL
ncbi:prepilin-type N-terminal cleavage/methylation domain-containing protein [Metabacillus malikii]|uniref:Prepilin-type N-terminal cleavage/methylation domain-containing protein n=1 Tax=Metabacillus malikii TaxID=1504265 RepID=A0ABT9ZKD2_9BACI|nr:prepilin-type N-terminal cleavage/methylation domain-containing protein [Metabacillus malikii]